MVKARLISKSRDGKTAEVVSYIGEGSQRRSVTNHLKRGKDGLWRGPNPDKAAVARLDAAERVEDGAAKAVAFFSGKTLEFEDAIRILKEKKAELLDPKEYRKARRELGRLHKEATAKLAETMGISEAAKKAADEVRAEVQRYPEFVF